MSGNLFTTAAPKDIGYGVVQFLRKRIQYTDNTVAIKVGTIPAGSLIHKAMSGVVVHTVANAGTANVIDVGYINATTTDDDYFGTDISLTALNFVPLDETVTGYYVSVDTIITATMGLTGTAATTGDVEVLIAYMTGGR